MLGFLVWATTTTAPFPAAATWCSPRARAGLLASSPPDAPWRADLQDRLARLDEDLGDQGRPAGPNDNAVVTGDDMGDAVDLDAEGGALLDGDDHMPAPAD